MKLSKQGLELIKSFEGLSLKACKCVSTEKYYTIGYGHYGADVKKTDIITKQQALKLLESDTQKFVDKVNKYVDKYKFNQNQFDALVSFAYNVGSIDGLTNNGKRTIKEISDSFTKYVKSSGIVLQGLVKRRTKEQQLFNTPISKTVYYQCNVGLIEIMNLSGIADTSLKHRKQIAEANGVENYKGTTSQNILLLKLLIDGKLIKE